MNQLTMHKIQQLQRYADKKAFAGAFATVPAGQMMAPRPLKCNYAKKNKLVGLDALLEMLSLREGMTISFHHALRNGDLVMQKIVRAISDKGIRGLRLSASSLSEVQEALIPYLQNGTIVAIESSGMRNKLGSFVQKNRLQASTDRPHAGLWVMPCRMLNTRNAL